MYKAVVIRKGSGGWGGPLTLLPTEEKHIILNVTGGGIHPLARHIADLTGAEVVDGFSTSVNDEAVLAVVIDCGGTARCGVYPRKGIKTVNVVPVGQSGPLANYIREDLYVSGVTAECIAAADGETAVQAEREGPAAETAAAVPESEPNGPAVNGITRIGIGIGKIVNKFYAAGRESVDITIKSILPFMAFVSMILGIITATGIGNVIAVTISPVAGSLPGCWSFPSFVPFPLFHLYWDPARLLLRLWAPFWALKSAWVIYRRNMRCRPSLPSIRKWVPILFPSASASAKRSRKRWNWVCPPSSTLVS